MSAEHDRICPWCQTEIIWDPEIGPEEECPHCLGELGDYRSLSVNVKSSGDPILLDEDEDEDEDEETEDFDLLEEDAELMDAYEEGVQALLDQQEEAPECSSCHSFMLLAGSQDAPPSFRPFMHGALSRPLLAAAFRVQVYVCPTCFKVEQQLSEADRLAMISQLRQEEGSSD